jgi:hypothetical protein
MRLDLPEERAGFSAHDYIKSLAKAKKCLILFHCTLSANARIARIAPIAPNAPNAPKLHPLVLVKKVKKAKAAAIKPQ